MGINESRNFNQKCFQWTFTFIYQVGKNGRTLGIKNSTKEETKYHATGTRRMMSSTTVSDLPDKPCYTSFFTNATPPDGLRDPKNSNIKYICQVTSGTSESVYSTMFDLDQGIAVVAAYTLKPGDEAFQKRTGFGWNPTPGKFFTCVWKQDPF